MTDSLYWSIFHKIDSQCMAYHGDRYGPDKQDLSGFIYGMTEKYSKLFGISQGVFLNVLEQKRGGESPINFYQEYNFPALEKVIVFQTKKEAHELCKEGFRCFYCNGVSSDGQECNSGILVDRICSDVKKKQPCNWKSYGLFSSSARAIIIAEKTYKPVVIFQPIYIENQIKQAMSQSDNIIDLKKKRKKSNV